MGLQQLDANGNMAWNCHSGVCQPQTAHISHEQVEHIAPDAVLLPPCPECGSRMGLKTVFSAAELKAPNMVDRNGRPTQSYAMAQRHIQLVQQLEAAGKAYTAPQAAVQPAQSRGRVVTLIGNALSVQVDGVKKTTFTPTEQQELLDELQQHGIAVNTFADVEQLLTHKEATKPQTSTTAG